MHVVLGRTSKTLYLHADLAQFLVVPEKLLKKSVVPRSQGTTSNGRPGVSDPLRKSDTNFEFFHLTVAALICLDTLAVLKVFSKSLNTKK